MQAFHFDPSTRAYAGQSPADPDQQRPGEWLYPAFSTNIAPPMYDGASHVAVFHSAPTENDPYAGTWHVEALPPVPVPVAPPAATPSSVAPPAAPPPLSEAVMPPELSQAEKVTLVRGQLLASCDWVVIRAMERGEPVPDKWVGYRQALRAVDAQEGYPDNITWPELPK